MATTEEIIADINATKDQMVAATNKLTKIGQAVVDAFAGVKAQAGLLDTALQAQDDKVPDAPTP